ncbi:MAG: 50S ribosomal protein L18e [Nitrososphaeria archaeon]
MKRKASNPMVRETLMKLGKISGEGNSVFWRPIMDAISSPSSRRPVVNVGKISRFTKENDVVLVPGKVLGDGLIDHPITVGALAASKSASEKIRAAGGSLLTLIEFAERYRDGSKVVVIGG